jgi:hypothetical protein
MNAAQIELRTNPRIQHGRAVNAVAEYLRNRLSVPNIFIKPKGFPGLSVDVLAVDHAGAGDLHAVEIKLDPEIEAGFHELRSKSPAGGRKSSAQSFDEAAKILHEKHLPQKAREFHSELMIMPAHYRYLAISLEHRDNLFGYFAPLGLYSPDGIGRIGLITLSQSGDRLPEVLLEIAPERFRVDPKKVAAIDKVLDKAKPDMEIRI